MNPEPGISHALATQRALQIADLHYAVAFDLPSERLAAIAADVTMTFTLSSVEGPLVIDFAPNTSGGALSCSVNDEPTHPVAVNGHLLLPDDRLCPGVNTVRFTFVAGDAPLNRRDDHLYTIFVPARAHEAFPCFDQPDLKARWTLTLTVPLEWTAVANADIATRTNVTTIEGMRTVIQFAETELLPTYLFAFAAGRFMEDTASRDGRRIRIYHCGVDPEVFARNRAAILDGHAEALRWLESYTETPYPFSKFDIVLLPAFQFNGMEHPGAIFYSAAAVLLDPSATRQHLLARADVIAHETSHLWFGDLWTMRWFDDVWLKEALANYMAAKIVNPRFPDLDHDLRFLHTNYPMAYDVDRTAGTHAIRQPLDNLNDAGSLYGAIIYLKSPIVMRQLAMLIGEQTLREALCEFLVRYRFGNAGWEDLLDLLASHTAVDLHAWSRAWIDGAGRPIVRADVSTGNGLAHLNLHSENAAASDGALDGAPRQKWPQRLEVGLGYGKWVEHIAMSLDGRADLATVVGYPPPAWVLPNGRGIGYGEFRLDAGSLQWLLTSLPEVPDALTRAAAWLTLWDAMLAKDIEPEPLLALAVRAVPLETSELNLQRILIYIERLFWVFLTKAQRETNAKWLCAILRTALERAPSISRKAALFGCLRAVATTDAMVDWIRSLWRGDTRIDGLPLSDGDLVMLVKELAVRVPDGAALVQQQVGRTRTREGREALMFVAPALSPEPDLRARFFATISERANRRREPWVVDGMRWLHHPLRADASVEYIEPGLLLLSEVKRTSDIFLPKRWVDAMLAGHNSPRAAATVRRFLDTRPPDYPIALRRMVLASADYLFRAASAETGLAQGSSARR